MLKIGDKVYCIRDYINTFVWNNSNDYTNKLVHKAGNFYSVDSLVFGNDINLYVSTEKNTTPNDYLGFYYNVDDRQERNERSFFMYFTDDIRVYRKLKLKKLNETIQYNLSP